MILSKLPRRWECHDCNVRCVDHVIVRPWRDHALVRVHRHTGAPLGEDHSRHPRPLSSTLRRHGRWFWEASNCSRLLSMCNVSPKRRRVTIVSEQLYWILPQFDVSRDHHWIYEMTVYKPEESKQGFLVQCKFDNCSLWSKMYCVMEAVVGSLHKFIDPMTSFWWRHHMARGVLWHYCRPCFKTFPD